MAGSTRASAPARPKSVCVRWRRRGLLLAVLVALAVGGGFAVVHFRDPPTPSPARARVTEARSLRRPAAAATEARRPPVLPRRSPTTVADRPALSKRALRERLARGFDRTDHLWRPVTAPPWRCGQNLPSDLLSGWASSPPLRPVLLFVHLQKCAGSAIEHVLQERCGGGTLHNFNFRRLSSTQLFDPVMTDESWIGDMIYADTPVDALLGHLPFGTHTHIPERFPVYFTWLRDPLDRAISHFWDSCVRRHRELDPVLAVPAIALRRAGDVRAAVEERLAIERKRAEREARGLADPPEPASADPTASSSSAASSSASASPPSSSPWSAPRVVDVLAPLVAQNDSHACGSCPFVATTLLDFLLEDLSSNYYYYRLRGAPSLRQMSDVGVETPLLVRVSQGYRFGGEPNPVDEVITTLRTRFAFVGVVEKFDESLRVLARLDRYALAPSSRTLFDTNYGGGGYTDALTPARQILRNARLRGLRSSRDFEPLDRDILRDVFTTRRDTTTPIENGCLLQSRSTLDDAVAGSKSKTPGTAHHPAARPGRPIGGNAGDDDAEQVVEGEDGVPPGMEVGEDGVLRHIVPRTIHIPEAAETPNRDAEEDNPTHPEYDRTLRADVVKRNSRDQATPTEAERVHRFNSWLRRWLDSAPAATAGSTPAPSGASATAASVPKDTAKAALEGGVEGEAAEAEGDEEVEGEAEEGEEEEVERRVRDRARLAAETAKEDAMALLLPSARSLLVAMGVVDEDEGGEGGGIGARVSGGPGATTGATRSARGESTSHASPSTDADGSPASSPPEAEQVARALVEAVLRGEEKRARLALPVLRRPCAAAYTSQRDLDAESHFGSGPHPVDRIVRGVAWSLASDRDSLASSADELTPALAAWLRATAYWGEYVLFNEAKKLQETQAKCFL